MGQTALSRTLAIVPVGAVAAVSRAETKPLPNHSMHIPPQSPTHGSDWRRRIFALAALSLLAGCGTQGDFGEVSPSFVRDDIHDWLGREVAWPATWLSNSYLTDDERQLRDLAYPLIEAPYNRQQWYSIAGEYGVIGSDHRQGFDRTAYADHLISKRFRSATARYAQLTEDIRNDTTRLPQFFETAARVLDIDQKRRKSLAYVSELSKSERDNALRRIRENASIVFKVRSKLDQRVSGYRFALERLVIMTPMQQAVDVERSLNQLQAQIAHYRTRSAPTWVREQSLASAR
jgi:hypothetical protein